MFRQATTRLFSRQRNATNASSNTTIKRTRRAVLLVGAATTGAVVSYKTRTWRNQHIQELPDWQELLKSPHHKNRNIDELTTTMKRSKLMGTIKQGVSQELEDIRKWHVDHGYKGGLVLRELNTPIFSHHHDDDDEDTPEFEFLDSMALARRECYYLYYEVKGNGQITQQIFCRGTTLGVDILTCLSFLYKYDPDLQCNIHRGFLNHANHLLRDVLPLLAPPSDKRATIEISGHSLGGAVAFLLAMKLRLKGYNVVKLTTIGAPRFCSPRNAARLSQLLPLDTLRIEDDLDVVPFLPPFASHLGDKLWMVHTGGRKNNDDKQQDAWAKFVSYPQFPWTESVWTNFRLYEVLSSFSKHHRVLNYAAELLQLTTQDQKNDSDAVSTFTSDDWERPR